MKEILFAAVSLEVGGTEAALVTLLNYLEQKDDYKITLVLEKKEGIFLKRLNNNIEVIEYAPNANKILPIRKTINLIKQIKFKIKYKNKFDFSCAYATSSRPASFIARTSSQNSCLWVHSEYMQKNNNNKKEYIKFFRKQKAEKFQNIVFVSEKAKNIFDKTFSENKELVKKTKIIHNLINAEEIIKKSKEKITDCNKENTYTFLNVGRHTEEDKRLTRLIQAAKKLDADKIDFRILLVGNGNKTEEYKQKVKEYGLENKVQFLGKKQNPYPYFKISNSLILTSEYEGFPVVYLEAMLLELPIITTDVSDSLKIVQDKYGIVTKKDVDSIYNAMKQAIKNGIEIKEKFDYKKYNQEIKEKLEKMINS